MRILITFADDLIEPNLRVHLDEAGEHEVTSLKRGADWSAVATQIAEADAVVHLDGVGPADDDFDTTGTLCDAIDLAAAAGRRPILIHIASGADAPGTHDRQSASEAEARIDAAAQAHGLNAYLFRVPHIFGKWQRPDSGSIVATLCHGAAHGLPSEVRDSEAVLQLVYIDDLSASILMALGGRSLPRDADGFTHVTPEYRVSLGEIAGLLQAFRDSRQNHVVERVGVGLPRALYSTYLSYMEPADFSYPITAHSDPRGSFAEMLRTKDSGQISFFTAGPGVTRGGHYHHTKTEKFLVVRGKARFKFRHIVTGQGHVLETDDRDLRIVETMPGWTHDITNVGESEMLVMLWANEQFNSELPDTVYSPL